MPDSEWEREFDDFFRRVSSRLVGQAFVMSGDLPTAQDLAQDALATAWSHWSRVRGLDNPEAWVRHVLHNLMISDWRKRSRRWARSADEREVPPPDVDAIAVATAMQALPERQRRAIVLHDAAGLPVAAIAREIGVPEGTVRSWLSRGRAVLAQRLRLVEDVDKGVS